LTRKENQERLVKAVQITEVRIYLVSNNDKLKAFANVTFDDCFLVGGLRVISGTNGLFVSYPSRKLKNGTFKDIVHPLNNDTRKLIEDKVLAAYEEKLKEPASAAANEEVPYEV
jgi:stage V sporulation protein G